MKAMQQTQLRSPLIAKLTYRFRQQQRFCAEPSPLSARICALVCTWLEQEQDCFGPWLAELACGRNSFEIPLLLLAGLHHQVLSRPRLPLGRYYPSVGGGLSANDAGFAPALRHTVETYREPLAIWLRQESVQTNESARGLCWLMPLSHTGWPEAHVAELGASAGLNLVAEQHCYRLHDVRPQPQELGMGKGIVFKVESEGEYPAPGPLPRILSRNGCDAAPLLLQYPSQQQKLIAFVWPDQIARLATLQQAMSILAAINVGSTPVQLHGHRLPEGLPDFLEQLTPQTSAAPLVLFNTYLTNYLADRGASLSALLADWVRGRGEPLLWLQWENLWRGEEAAPELGWLAWTADLWWRQGRLRWLLAWVHPHGRAVRWLPGALDWAEFWRRQGQN